MISAIRQRFHNIMLALVSWIARVRSRDALWASIAATRLSRRIDELIWGPVEWAVTLPARRKLPPFVEHSSSKRLTTVDRHWEGHTIRGKFFLSRQDSLDYIVELTDGRPYKRQLLRLHGPHAGKTVLDYGCGPGNDLAGFAEYSAASRIIGMDISRRALQPIARCVRPADVSTWVAGTGLNVEFLGGYFVPGELELPSPYP